MFADGWLCRNLFKGQAMAILVVCAMRLGLLSSLAIGQDSDSPPLLPKGLALAQQTEPAKKATVEFPITPPTAAPVLTEAELITRLQRTIAGDERRLEDLRCDIADPTNEYYKAEVEFRTIDDRFTQEKSDLAKAIEEKQDDVVEKLKAALADTEKNWKLARERFDLAIQTRKTQQEQMAVLEGKVKQDRAALDKLTGARPPTTEAPLTTPQVTSSEATSPTAATPPAANTATAGVIGAETAIPPSSPVQSTKAPSQEIIAAKQSVDDKQQAAQEAEQEARSVSERLAALDRNIAIEQKLLDAARKKSDLANQSRLASEQEYQKKSAEGLMGNELSEIASRRSNSERQFQEARDEVRMRMDRLQELHAERATLQGEELAALREVKQKQDEALLAVNHLGELKNPFSLRNLVQWLLRHGPAMLMYLGIMYSLYKIMQLTTRRVVELMVQSSSRSPPEENEARVNTLVGVFQNAATLTIIIGGGIVMCEEAGLAVAPLMGGAAVLGLAVAFGAQNLIRDYFYGFVILLENQYKINDVLKIGEVSGQVERITLRMTVLRDLEGCVHFIPNGKIDCVSNMTHGWSRAVFDIGVSHKEDADRVMNVLLTLAMDLQREPEFSRLILDDPEMLGVDAIGSTGVTIKFVIKTRPLKQWAVKRELLRRIKRRFKELHIEMSMPQQFVLKNEEATGEMLPEDGVINMPSKAA